MAGHPVFREHKCVSDEGKTNETSRWPGCATPTCTQNNSALLGSLSQPRPPHLPSLQTVHLSLVVRGGSKGNTNRPIMGSVSPKHCERWGGRVTWNALRWHDVWSRRRTIGMGNYGLTTSTNVQPGLPEPNRKELKIPKSTSMHSPSPRRAGLSPGLKVHPGRQGFSINRASRRSTRRRRHDKGGTCVQLEPRGLTT